MSHSMPPLAAAEGVSELKGRLIGKGHCVRPLAMKDVGVECRSHRRPSIGSDRLLVNRRVVQSEEKSKWELVDLGSLNGTSLNSRSINNLVAGSRSSSDPVELSSGDVITLGSCSKISVQIVQDDKCELPFGVGIASDPMSMRRGGKKLPMEDMCYCRWPLPDIEQFGLFCIFDGHGGVGAAGAASNNVCHFVAFFHIQKVISRLQEILYNAALSLALYATSTRSQTIKTVLRSGEEIVNLEEFLCAMNPQMLGWTMIERSCFLPIRPQFVDWSSKSLSNDVLKKGQGIPVHKASLRSECQGKGRVKCRQTLPCISPSPYSGNFVQGTHPLHS
ncbi:Protein phosphatase 2C 70 [Platanthera guangdongensis]|uniref:protein-serine/threonine phosphatase n=1 Tax=Platanthera guangdongensis TaxID=2320717 RepID=A0ABR2MSJ3_9ASPA